MIRLNCYIIDTQLGTALRYYFVHKQIWEKPIAFQSVSFDLEWTSKLYLICVVAIASSFFYFKKTSTIDHSFDQTNKTLQLLSSVFSNVLLHPFGSDIVGDICMCVS